MSLPLLPQDDPNLDSRRAELEEQSAHYSFDYNQFEDIAAAPKVPFHELPSLSWGVQLAEILIKIMVNAAHIEKDLERTDPGHPKHRELSGFISDATKGGLHLAFEKLQGFIQGDNNDH